MVTKAKRRATHQVQAHAVTLEELATRVQTLLPQLDDRLMDLAANLIREHTEQQIHRRAR